eukprot:scaffold118515_cov28-Tisochrysis_lutea.AAC.1
MPQAHRAALRSGGSAAIFHVGSRPQWKIAVRPTSVTLTWRSAFTNRGAVIGRAPSVADRRGGALSVAAVNGRPRFVATCGPLAFTRAVLGNCVAWARREDPGAVFARGEGAEYDVPGRDEME